MRFYYSFALTILFFNLISAQNCHQAAWVKKFGGNELGLNILDSDLLPDGNHVLCGTYGTSGLVLGAVSLPAGTGGIFLAVMDSSGTFIKLSKALSGNVTIRGMFCGPDGSVSLVGDLSGIVDFGGNNYSNNTGAEQMLIVQYDPDFVFQWYRTNTWTGSDVTGRAVTGDALGNIYCGGGFSANYVVMGDTWVGNFGAFNSWTGDGWIMKLSPAGELIWLKHLGGVGSDNVYTLTCDTYGDIWALGATGMNPNGTFLFDQQLGVPGGKQSFNQFVAKYDGDDGHCLFGKILQGATSFAQMYPTEAIAGPDGGLFACGVLRGTVSVGPGTYTTADGSGYLMRLNNQGDCEWLKTMGGQGDYESADALAYRNGKIAVCGTFFSNQPYIGDFPAYSTLSGTYKGFNAQFLEDGSLEFARVYNANSQELYLQEVLLDAAGQQILAGLFKGSQTWYPITTSGSGTYLNIFLAKTVAKNPVPFTVSAGPDKTTTCGTNVQLQGSVSPGSVGHGWSPSLGFSANYSLTPSVNTGQPAAYILYGYYQGCILQDTVQVLLSNHNTTANAGPDAGFCIGDSLLLAGSSNQPGATFLWSPPMAVTNTAAASTWCKPNVSTTYILEANAAGCKAYDTISVEAKERPWIYLPKDDNYFGTWRMHLCMGEPKEVNLGLPSNTYTVTTPAAVANVNNNLITVLADNTNFLKVEAVSPAGCQNRDSVYVVVHNQQPPPPIINNLPDSRSVCAGDSLIQWIHFMNNADYDPYDFQFSWYGGWQVDSLDGLGWRDIRFWEVQHYETYLVSYGEGNSSYWSRLTIKNLGETTNGYRYRAYISDYCSDRSFSNAMTIYTGPKITQQPLFKNLCQGATDSISVNSAAANALYQWQVKQNGAWQDIVDMPGVISPNGRFLRFYNVPPGLNALYRCRVDGCNPVQASYSDSALVQVIAIPLVLSQTTDLTVCENTNQLLTFQTNTGPYSYQWYQGASPITFNTSQIFGYNNDTLLFTPVYLNQNNYTYRCRIFNTLCNVEVYTNPVQFEVIDTDPVTWSNALSPVCENAAAVNLSGGMPAGGTYSGPGVSGSTFDPGALSTGNYTLTYTFGNAGAGCVASANNTITVAALPVVALDLPDFICEDSGNVLLSGGSPAGGVYTGDYVSQAGNNYYFSTNDAGPGIADISYTYTNASNCTAVAEDTWEITPLPEVTWESLPVVVCFSTGAPVSLEGGMPTGGTYSGTGVDSGIFYPQQAGAGQHLLTYEYTDPQGCMGSSTQTATVQLPSVAGWSAIEYTYCQDDVSDYVLAWMFACEGVSVFAGPGVTQVNNDYFFNPAMAGGPGQYVLSATCGDPATDCDSTYFQTVTIETCTGTSTPGLTAAQAWVSGDRIYISTGQRVQCNLYNAIGQLICRSWIEGDAILPSGPLVAGSYFIEMSNEEYREIKRVLVRTL